MHTYIHTCIHAYIHTYIHAYIPICIGKRGDPSRGDYLKRGDKYPPQTMIL